MNPRPGGVGTVPKCVVLAATSGATCGTVCTGGSLAAIIPPSSPAVPIGPVASTSVGDVPIGMIAHGPMLVAAHVIDIFRRWLIRPRDGAPARIRERAGIRRQIAGRRAGHRVPPIIIITGSCTLVVSPYIDR